MKIRLIGFLNASQIENAVALSGKIEPEKGTLFIQKGLSFTFTFKGDKAMGVTVRRAPNLKILGDEDQEAKPAEPEPKELKFKIGEKVKINWEKSPYLKSSSYNDYGTVVDIIKPKDVYLYKVSGIHKENAMYDLHFRDNWLDKYVKETSGFEVGDRVKVKSKEEVGDSVFKAPSYTDRMNDKCAGKTYTITEIKGEVIHLSNNNWWWIKDWLEPVQEDA